MLRCMILMVQSVPVGNAARLILMPPAGATRCRVLRKAADDFTGWDDVGAVVVYDGDPERSVLDWNGLIDGRTYFYRAYWLVAGVWQPTASVSVVIDATDTDMSVDVLSIVRERIDLGLQEEIRRGNLNHPNNLIQVLTSPPLYDNTVWPLVTVHVNSDASGERAIGEMVAGDNFIADTADWECHEGWFSRWAVGIIGWSLNPDERIELRKAIKRIVIGNLAVFDYAGMLQVELQQQDVEEFERYSAPVYQTVGTLTCLAQSIDRSLDWAISDVVSQPVNP